MLAVYSLFLPFYLLAIIGFLGMMSTLVFLTERRRPEVFENIPKTRLRLNDQRIGGLMLIGAGTSFVQAILLQISAFFVLDVLHLNAQETTSLVGIGMMGMAIMTLFSQLVVIQTRSFSKNHADIRCSSSCYSILYVLVTNVENLTGREHGDFWFWLWSY